MHVLTVFKLIPTWGSRPLYLMHEEGLYTLEIGDLYRYKGRTYVLVDVIVAEVNFVRGRAA